MARNHTALTLKRAQTHQNKGETYKSLSLYQAVLDQFPENQQAIHGIRQLRDAIKTNAKMPPRQILLELRQLIKFNNPNAAFQQANRETKRYPHSAELWRIIGIASQRLGFSQRAEVAWKQAILIDPTDAHDHFALSIVLEDKGDLEEAEKYLNRSIELDPNFHQAHTNLGTILQKQGGRKSEAIKAYQKAIAIEPTDGLAHQYLSELVTYRIDDPQIVQVEHLLNNRKLGDTQNCHLHHAMAKMKEDIGELKSALVHYKASGALRRKELRYSFQQDQALFDAIKKAAPAIKQARLSSANNKHATSPIFILGMPRSGTTLVEQIISSHSHVLGAGELRLLGKHGSSISLGRQLATPEALCQFRQAYLDDLANLSSGSPYVADKLPQNFLQVGLICSALPKAKIIHTMRDPRATCWSNFKQNFQGRYLGYSHDLKSVVSYFKLYQELMAYWHTMFEGRIYDLNYERLTIDQEQETRKLIDYLELDWEDACLSPHRNKRVVKTASVEQVRQQVYQGSSESWKKYEPYLEGAFDAL